MVKIVPKVDNTNAIYAAPVVGPLVAIAEGIVVRVMVCSALKAMQGGALGLAWVFNIDNVTEIDYDTVIWSGFNLAYDKGLGGIHNQTAGAYNYFFSSSTESADATSNKVVVYTGPIDRNIDSVDTSISGVAYGNEDL